MSPSLNTLQPESIAHGTEITIQANAGSGAFVTIGEIYAMDYDEDEKLEAIGPMGTRRIGRRRGQFEVKGTIKSWWLNGALRSMVLGSSPPSPAGNVSSIYHSTHTFTRYQIQVTSTNASAPNCTFMNVTFEKDAVKWQNDKVTEEDINFFAEDVLGQ